MLKKALKGWRRHFSKSTVRLEILSKKARIGGIWTRSCKVLPDFPQFAFTNNKLNLIL
jgi:hypothetical protein